MLVTACNTKFFEACLTQIASVHRTSFETVDEYLVYDLGLSSDEINKLNQLQKVTVVKCPEPIVNVGDFAWKLDIVHSLMNRRNTSYLYLDSGAMAMQNLSVVFNLIRANGRGHRSSKYHMVPPKIS